MLVTEEAPDATVEERAERLNTYKPHERLEAARNAVEEVDAMLEQAREQGLAASHY